MKHIHFIINPIAGKGKNLISPSFLQKYFHEQDFNIVLKLSSYKNHSRILTQESMSQKADIIVACGGDGTINEVASCLVGSSIILGIIPIGSGNGLASNLKIPKNLHKALMVIKQQSSKKMDVGRLNSNYFFSNAGFGFSALAIKNYEISKKRKLLGYIKASLKALREIDHNNNIEISINNQTIYTNPLIIFISNSNQLGYNLSLTPKASLQDGLLDVLLVSKLNRLKILIFSVLALFQKHHFLKEVSCFQSKHIKISQTSTKPFYAQIDGESIEITDNTINLSILEKSLRVISN